MNPIDIPERAVNAVHNPYGIAIAAAFTIVMVLLFIASLIKHPDAPVELSPKDEEVLK